MTDHVTGDPTVLADRYELGGLIGRGGMAEVHVGRDTRLSRTVAVKMLRPDLARDPSFLARFRREAQSSAGLNHPAIVSVYDTGEHVTNAGTPDERRIPFIVMEYVEGHTVRELLGDGDPVPIAEAVDIVVGVLNALEYSHREGIVHRDIKPGNIMITPTGDVKVMDFGIARALSDNSATMTQPHSVVGTAQYLSPEQARGEVVDARSDLYSTGCLLFELLTGKPPFSGDSAVAVAYQHVRELPPQPSSIASDIPESLDRVVMQALAKDRDERYADAAHFRADLLAAHRGTAVAAPPTTSWARPAEEATRVVAAAPAAVAAAGSAASPVEGLRRSPQPVEEEERRSMAWLWILLGALVLVGGVVTYLLMSGGRDEPEPDPTTVPVPALEGLDMAQVRVALEDAELVPDFQDPESSDDVEEGLFLRSDPAPGEEAEIGSSVAVVMSAGPSEVVVPELEGLTEDEIRDALEEVDLELELDEPESSDDVPEGEFLRSTPAPGDSVPPGSTVRVVLSSGVGETTVPDVTDFSQQQARQAIEDAGLEVGEIHTVDEPAEANHAVRTDPEAGTAIARGSVVDLYLASGRVELLSLIGWSQTDAQEQLDALDLNSSISREHSEDYAEGEVISQSQTGLVDVGSTIELVISLGPEETDEPTTDPPTESPTD